MPVSVKRKTDTSSKSLKRMDNNFKIMMLITCVCIVAFHFLDLNLTSSTEINNQFSLNLSSPNDTKEVVKDSVKENESTNSFSIENNKSSILHLSSPNIEGTASKDRLEKNESTNRFGSDENSSILTLHELKHVQTAADGSCYSLKESSYYYPTPTIPPPSPALLEALRNHEKMQKRCVNGVKDWNAHFLKAELELEDCQYVVGYEIDRGLGNRLLSILSSFAYSLLTNRTLLIYNKGNIKSLLCNPFPETSWWLPDSFPFDDLDKSPFHTQYFESVKKIKNKKNNKARIMLDFTYANDEKHPLFFCDDVQEGLKKADWLGFISDQYLVPGFFLIPSFNQRLTNLFPHGLVLPYLARYLLHPSNQVWDRITRIYQAYFQETHLKVGVQIRNFNNYDSGVSERVLECIRNSGVLPPIMSDEEYATYSYDQVKSRSNRSMPYQLKKKYFLFIASLHLEYYDYIRIFFNKRPMKNQDSIVTVHSESHDSQESWDLEKDEVALIEMWLLSMSDVLFVSDFSTFGYVARALGSQTAYTMNICDEVYKVSEDRWKTNQRPVCVLLKYRDTCFHVPPRQILCPNAPPLVRDEFSSVESRIGKCEDVTRGITLNPN